ncbi:DUF3710 domain-containing protein [Corynebacterium poyangense]|uniref:DUF3710 domain-containing protein n=1 Tax=Corynebacterium poyangense TaxID=2684405 RepID=A0A7H0SP77_9CORY|nr:DUF3710 domain-containing protein [Corynebacterium poyangense]MBZ8177923.1 DUF3710 domain-containing protein [Corynebacterium poyangense]QNQ90352.1 DUF3710 domain-containing protein [Corynebacterium poyangense]
MSWFRRKNAAAKNVEEENTAIPDEANPVDSDPAEEPGIHDVDHDAVSGDVGPFDGDSVNIADCDFSDFSEAVLDLGSIKIPLPKDSQVQVELGPQGPQSIHIVTRVGRITPAVFAAPRSEGLWRKATVDIRESMREQGLEPRIEQGPWGREVVTEQDGNQIRLLGVDGPRWMLRFTAAGPEHSSAELAELSREVAARTFVYRGDNPVLAGNSLPVVLPEVLSDQVRQEMQRRAQQHQQGQA